MRAERFLDWLYFTTGLHADQAREKLTADERSALLTVWIKSGCPYPTGY